MAACGARNVFVANQVVGRANIEKLSALTRHYPTTRFLLLVDFIEGVDQSFCACCIGTAFGPRRDRSTRRSLRRS